MSNKKRILCWSDAPTAATGFGTVSKYVIAALNATNKYEIDQLAINYHGQFVSRDVVPWQMSPARLQDPNDPYGNKMFLRTIAEHDYDYIWIMNDTFVVHHVAKDMRELIEQKAKSGRKKPKVIYYYPVDCKVLPEAAGMLRLCDFPVAYNTHGVEETIKVLPELRDKLTIIHHGTDTQSFKPYSKEIIAKLKEKYFGIKKDKFLVINFNRNNPRKQIAKTMLVFKEFKKKVPDSLLYLHTAPQDKDIDLLVAARDLGLKPKEDLVFPVSYSPSHGYPVPILNELYNCGDVFLTTHLGEGWGLTVTEAMATGVPVIAPDNTSMPEIIGSNDERGFLYHCDDMIYMDNSGFRPVASTQTILDKLLSIHSLGWKHNLPQVVAARKWVEENSWAKVCGQWLTFFSNLENQVELPENSPEFIGELL